jgi:hypothetical protein
VADRTHFGKTVFPQRVVPLWPVSQAALYLVLFTCCAQSHPQQAVSLSHFLPRREVLGEKFVGPGACASCHHQKSSSQPHTAMARALHNPADSDVLRSHARMTLQKGQYLYEIVRQGQQILYRVTDGQQTISEPVSYSFGNARVAETYVLRHNGKLYEGRVSYYTAIDGLDWTIGDALSPPPSLEEAMGRDISGDEARNCFSCHGTAAVANTKLDLNGLIPGVTCEACHGPGQKHAVVMLSDVRAEPFIFNPKTLDPDRLSQEFCGACHRGVDTVAMMPDLGGISNVRFQPYRLYNSRGHDPKDARLACTACHDPHSDLQKDVAAYDEKCTICHPSFNAARVRPGPQKKGGVANPHPTEAASKTCPVAKERCVSCHMPKVELPGAHFKFTDHRIRIQRSGEPYPF